jgi:DNA ligase (NAD+)
MDVGHSPHIQLFYIKEVFMLTKEELEEIIRKYNQGLDTGYTDEEYDALLEEYLKTYGESNRPFNRNKQSDSVNDIVGTLPKVYGVQKAMRDNQTTYRELVEKRGMTGDICLQPKFDGCSVAVDFTTGRFFTRGDYDDGTSVDVTDVFADHLSIIKKYASYPGNGTTAMKFEAIMSSEAFHANDFDKHYRRARDFVAATITSRNTEMARWITLIPLRGYWNKHQYIPRALTDDGLCLFCRVDDYTGIESFIKDRLDAGATVQFNGQTYAIDGVVASPIELTDEGDDDIDVVFTEPSKEIAIKILYNVKKTKLITVEYQFGKQGRITPVAILEPVQFDTITVDHATLSTVDRVLELKLRHNDTVNVMYNIVPYLIDSDHDGDVPIQIPKNCPICGSPLTFMTLRQVRCSNPDCKGLRLGAIIRHAEKMKMVGLGAGVITKLYDAGIVTKIEDLYELRYASESIQSLPGFGHQSYWNILTSINDAVKNATLSRFLGALPFNDISEETWKSIMTVISEEVIITTMIDGTFPKTIMSVNGYIPSVGELKIRKIIDGYLRNKDEIISLMRWIPNQLKQTKRSTNTKGKIAMTGTRDPELTKALEASGYEVGSFTKDCVALIVPSEDFTSAKTEKAKELGIKIYTIEQANQLLVEPF